MFTAAMVTAIALTVSVPMVVAGGIVIADKRISKESCDCFIGISRISSIESDACFLHGHLCAAAYPATYQHIHISIP